MKLRSAVVALAVAVLGIAAGAFANDFPGHETDIPASGAFTCDFGLPGDLPFDQVPFILELDRTHMSARSGFIRKYVPLRIDPFTGEVSSGGRYLFDSKEDADAYRDWATNDFMLDGVKFFERPYFFSPDCRSWSVIGAHDFAAIDAHVVVRTERWTVPSDNQRQLLKDRWPAVRAAAAARGLSSVWLLYDRRDGVVSLVSVANRVVPADPYVPDFSSLLTVENTPTAGEVFDDQSWTRVFDRTHWVLTTWFPFQEGDTGLPSLWPNSPPFPRP